ncbi:12625_t:CDS:2, partial [Dentiscutata erythropus]
MPPLPHQLGEIEGSKQHFSNKTDRIISHFKKYTNFVAESTAEEREEIFKLVDVPKK